MQNDCIYLQVQMRRTGQAFQLGRYSLHWHMHGDAEYKQYMRGCTVSQAWNRAVTIHGTNNVNLTDNVAYNIMGGLYLATVATPGLQLFCFC